MKLMKKNLLIGAIIAASSLVLSTGISYAQCEIKVYSGLSNNDLLKAPGRAAGVTYQKREGRFLYGAGVEAYQMRIKNVMANPAVPFYLFLNYQVARFNTIKILAGANIGAGHVFTRGTIAEGVPNGGTPCIGFVGGQVQARKEICGGWAFTAEYTYRYTQMDYTFMKYNRVFTLPQNLLTFGISYVL